MPAFRSIEELLKTLSREQRLLKELFAKRKILSFRYEDALALVEYREERIRKLIDSEVVRENGSFLELEDSYLQFFEQIPSPISCRKAMKRGGTAICAIQTDVAQHRPHHPSQCDRPEKECGQHFQERTQLQDQEEETGAPR